MKKLAYVLTLASGLYLSGKAKAEGSEQLSNDSNAAHTTQLAILDVVSLEAGAVAEALISAPEYAGLTQRQDAQASKEFEMALISAQAGQAAEMIREGGE